MFKTPDDHFVYVSLLIVSLFQHSHTTWKKNQGKIALTTRANNCLSDHTHCNYDSNG